MVFKNNNKSLKEDGYKSKEHQYVDSVHSKRNTNISNGIETIACHCLETSSMCFSETADIPSSG